MSVQMIGHPKCRKLLNSVDSESKFPAPITKVGPGEPDSIKESNPIINVTLLLSIASLWRIPPGNPNSFNFMQFLGKIWQNRMLVPRGVGAPPRGNPRSATASYLFHSIFRWSWEKFMSVEFRFDKLYSHYVRTICADPGEFTDSCLPHTLFAYSKLHNFLR